MMNYLASAFVAIPILAALIILILPNRRYVMFRNVALISAVINLLLALFVFFTYDRAQSGFQFAHSMAWIPSLGIAYHAGLDGIGVTMVLLHSILSFSALMVSKSIQTKVKSFYIFMLLLIASIYGVFVSLNLFFLYLFYEMAVIPMYPLIAIWGSKNKEYGAMKLTLYISLGAVVALFGLIALYLTAGLQSFDLIVLKEYLQAHPLPFHFQHWCAPLLIFGFGVIASIWPLHSWSPIGYAVAPSPVSMLHAGVLKKLGIFFIIRVVLTLLPEGAKFWMPVVAGLCVINVLYGAWAAMVQNDMKYTIGFASVSHMGYAFLGLTALNETGLTATVFFLFAHGIMAALCFALIGFIYDQAHTRLISDFGGLAKQIPFISVCFIIAAFASSGLPGFANFVSEVLIFFSVWNVHRLAAILAILGIVITATYMLRLIRNVFFGELKPAWYKLKDPNRFEKIPFILLVSVLLVFGFWPQPLLHLIQPSAASIIYKAPPSIPLAKAIVTITPVSGVKP